MKKTTVNEFDYFKDLMLEAFDHERRVNPYNRDTMEIDDFINRALTFNNDDVLFHKKPNVAKHILEIQDLLIEYSEDTFALKRTNKERKVVEAMCWQAFK